jgi:hypothetical protein
MPTYSNLGIKLIDTGAEAGTWGVSTNTNFEYFDTAIVGYVSIALTAAGSSGAPNTLNVADYSASAGRNRIIEFTSASDLGSAAYVQITPNDFEGYYFIRNSLLNSRSIFIFQGTYDAARDFEIPNGKDVILRCTGGGDTSSIVNVVDDLLVDSITANNVITSTFTANTITANTQFVGPGTGLTGTAASLNIGGNAATATTATTATNTSNVNITNDTSSASTVYPTWVSNVSGFQGVKVSSTKVTLQPSTGTLTSTILRGTTILATGAYQETRVAMAGGVSIDLALGNYFQKTIAAATTFTVTNVPAAGTAASIILDLTNGGSAAITWWSGVKWAGGTAPTLTTAGRDALGFYTFDGGTTWTGLLLGKNFS